MKTVTSWPVPKLSVGLLEEQRMRSIKICVESIAKLSSAAISLENQYNAEVTRSESLLASGMEKESALALSRAVRIHQERCRTLQRIASFARLATIEASGDLLISRSTSHTGLDELDRINLSEVLGCVE